MAGCFRYSKGILGMWQFTGSMRIPGFVNKAVYRVVVGGIHYYEMFYRDISL